MRNLFLLLAVTLSIGLYGCNRKPSSAKPQSSPNVPHPSSAEDQETLPEFCERDAKDLVDGIGRLIEENEIRIPNAWKKLPSWLSKDLPFDASAYFGMPESDNGESLYLRATLKVSPRDGYPLLSIINMSDHENWPADIKKTYELARTRTDQYYFFLLSKEPVDTAYPNELRRFLATYESAIKDVVSAQELPHHHLISDFDIQGLEMTFGFPRTFANILALRNLPGLDSQTTISDLKTGLCTARDFGKLSSFVTQLNSTSAESICLSDIAFPLLQQAEDPKQIQRLIAVLVEHVTESNSLHRFVERTRYEYFMLRMILKEIESGTLKLSKELEEMFSSENLSPPLAAHKMLIHLKFYSGNKNEIEKMIAVAAKASNKSNESIRNTLNAAKQPYDSGEVEAMLLLPAINQSVNSMQPTDFQAEIDVLAQRCRDSQSAADSKYPERIEKLTFLQENWTFDPAWKNTKFLKWYKPQGKLVAAEVRSDVKSRGMLCLAAVRKWQLEHGQLPGNVNIALAAVDVDPKIAVDPFTGGDFKILESSTCSVYSVGPDQVDDGGLVKLEYVRADPAIKGDIVFDLADKDAFQ